MDRAKCRSLAGADSHLHASPIPGPKPGAKLRDQIRRCLPTSAPLRPIGEGLRPDLHIHPLLSAAIQNLHLAACQRKEEKKTRK